MRSKKIFWVLAIAIAAIPVLSGCGTMDDDDQGSTAGSVTIGSVVIGIALSQPALEALTSFTASDVGSVTVDVLNGGTQISTTSLTFGGVIPGVWSGSFSDLPVGPLLQFDGTAETPNPKNTIFFGSVFQTLTPNLDVISIDLAPVDDGDDLLFPQILSLDNPPVAVNQTVTVTLVVAGEKREDLLVVFDVSDPVNSNFTTPSQTIGLPSGQPPYTATATSGYTAPASAGTYLQTVTLTNEQGNAVELNFPINVTP
ncbi:MAG: hypothetical protein IID61_18330 [SAR324 cluster bacterium]|nr:hypothetical protein [SAR324 cluster bacterium]